MSQAEMETQFCIDMVNGQQLTSTLILMRKHDEEQAAAAMSTNLSTQSRPYSMLFNESGFVRFRLGNDPSLGQTEMLRQSCSDLADTNDNGAELDTDHHSGAGDNSAPIPFPTASQTMASPYLLLDSCSAGADTAKENELANTKMTAAQVEKMKEAEHNRKQLERLLGELNTKTIKRKLEKQIENDKKKRLFFLLQCVEKIFES